MTVWVVTPRDPLVVRDGRPNQGRSESATIPFPAPSTVAGVVRTRLGSDGDNRFVAHGDLDALKRVTLRGPLLTAPEDRALFVPAPRDALILKPDAGHELRALRPLDRPEGALFDEDAPERLVGVAPDEVIDGKVPADLPAWWRWEALADWLGAPRRGHGAEVEALLRGGLRALPREQRVHVKLGPEGVAEESMLFETAGLRFVDPGGDSPTLAAQRPLALLVAVDAPAERPLRAGLGPFAGERRIVRWERSEVTLPPLLPVVRARLAEANEKVRVRVVLLTPAWFAAGHRPSLAADTPLGSRDGVTVTLAAALVPRPETLSGWDLAADGPKATRRFVPAGSVLWLDLAGSGEARAKWAEGVWMQNVSDDDQARRDGFGLAVLGVT